MSVGKFRRGVFDALFYAGCLAGSVTLISVGATISSAWPFALATVGIATALVLLAPAPSQNLESSRGDQR